MEMNIHYHISMMTRKGNNTTTTVKQKGNRREEKSDPLVALSQSASVSSTHALSRTHIRSVFRFSNFFFLSFFCLMYTIFKLNAKDSDGK